MATPTTASNHYDAPPRSMFQNWPPHPYSSSNADKVYSQGNSATLTCDSGYVLNDSRYLKTAPIFCNYTSSDGSTWKLIPKENNDKLPLKPAACIRGKRKYQPNYTQSRDRQAKIVVFALFYLRLQH